MIKLDQIEKKYSDFQLNCSLEENIYNYIKKPKTFVLSACTCKYYHE